ncbi:ATP-binding cassette domain-containing protein [Paracoccaceae bacterium GXU_MW_L88]
MSGALLSLENIRLDRDQRGLLDILSLRISGDGPTVIMGPNGAGKSLLLRVMHGLIAPDRGRIFSGGQPLDLVARKKQAMVFQRPVLLRRSVGGNMRFALRVAGVSKADQTMRCRDLLALSGLEGKENQAARSLSGGEQQRLAIARALAMDPAVLLLDEPTANLDPAATAQVEVLIHEVSAKGVKVVLVTHDPGQARRIACDVVFLHAGKVVEHSPAATFFDAPETAEARAFLSGELVV